MEDRRGIETSMGQAGECAQCGFYMPDGPDLCLGLIPGVSHACCGHGDPMKAYVVLGGEPDQDVTEMKVPPLVIRGEDAMTFFDIARRARVAGENQIADGRPV